MDNRIVSLLTDPRFVLVTFSVRRGLNGYSAQAHAYRAYALGTEPAAGVVTDGAHVQPEGHATAEEAVDAVFVAMGAPSKMSILNEKAADL